MENPRKLTPFRQISVSKDLEDIVFLINYGMNLQTEIYAADNSLKEYISKRFKLLLSRPELKEAIFCVLPAGENDPVFVDNIIGELKSFTK